jgi:hypothetical protein
MLLLKPVREGRTKGAFNFTFKPVAASRTPDYPEDIICIMVIHL